MSLLFRSEMQKLDFIKDSFCCSQENYVNFYNGPGKGHSFWKVNQGKIGPCNKVSGEKLFESILKILYNRMNRQKSLCSLYNKAFSNKYVTTLDSKIIFLDSKCMNSVRIGLVV